MVKKKKNTVAIGGLEIYCSCSRGRKVVKLIDLDFDHSVDECELCGSHGYLKMEVACPECGAELEVELESW